MSILKALQKKQSEQPNNSVETTVTAKIVPFEANGTRVTGAPLTELFAEKSLKIGTPTTSAFNGQSNSAIGKALPETEFTQTAGATLNAVALPAAAPPIAAAQAFPEFAVWNVEAERVEPRLVAITHPHSTYCEEYRSLRTQVLHKSQRQKLQSIVVASINASEGKSVTALNLSWLLAQTDGVKALIIDSDLRMPSLTDYLGIETDKGLSDVLSGRTTLKESIIRLDPAGLHLLPGGEARSDVAELISGPKFKEILREAKEIFDYVIIDAPPLGIFTDANVLINHADGAMLVIRANRTRYAAVDRILESLPRDRMLGVVLNQSEDVMDESHYNYGHYGRKK